jgi:hypothetical protein
LHHDQIKSHKLFTKKDHVNTLAIDPDGRSLWAVLHNLGPSKLMQIDLQSSAVIRQLQNIGT